MKTCSGSILRVTSKADVGDVLIAVVIPMSASLCSFASLSLAHVRLHLGHHTIAA